MNIPSIPGNSVSSEIEQLEKRLIKGAEIIESKWGHPWAEKDKEYYRHMALYDKLCERYFELRKQEKENGG